MATVTTALCRLAWLPDLRPGVRSKVRCSPAASPTFDTAFAFRCSRHGEAGTHAWGRHPVTPDTRTASLAGQQAFGKVKASSAQEFPTGQAPQLPPRRLCQASSGNAPILTEQPHIQGTEGGTLLSDCLPKRRGFRELSALPSSSQRCCESLSRALGLAQGGPVHCCLTSLRH